MALHYLVSLKFSKDQNSNIVNKNIQGINRRLQDAGGSPIFDDVDTLVDKGGVLADGLDDDELTKQLCNGVRLAIREDTQVESFIYLPSCRVFTVKSDEDNEADDQASEHLVIYNSFEEFKVWKMDLDTPTESLTVPQIENDGTSSSRQSLEFKND